MEIVLTKTGIAAAISMVAVAVARTISASITTSRISGVFAVIFCWKSYLLDCLHSFHIINVIQSPKLGKYSFFNELFSYNFYRVIKENHCFLLTIYLKFLSANFNFQYTGDSLIIGMILMSLCVS
jgi:hypothetical protein